MLPHVNSKDDTVTQKRILVRRGDDLQRLGGVVVALKRQRRPQHPFNTAHKCWDVRANPNQSLG